MTSRTFLLLPAVALIAAGTMACSAGEDPSATLGGGGAGAATTGGTGGTGGTAGSGGGGGGMGFDAGDQDGSLTDGEICEATEAQAEKIPLDMVMVVDRSGSMSGTEWNGTVNALTAFFNDPSSDGITVGMNFYPVSGVSCPACDPALYNPLHVAMDILPGYAQTLINAMAAENPSGGCTPTYGALFGGLEVAVAHQDNNPNHKVIVVLATDGYPNSCPGNQNETAVIAGIAASAFNYNGVQTFCIAIQGSNVADLNQIAAAGGTGQAYDVTQDISLFLQKMEEIRSAALGCEYLIPEPEPPEVFDPLKVNVVYTPGGVGNPQTIPQADNLADCGAGPGWYYDDPNNPTKIILCPASCQTIENDSEAQVNIAFGCPTEVN